MMKLSHPESMWLLISDDLTGLLQMGQSTAMVAVVVPITESQRASLVCYATWQWTLGCGELSSVGWQIRIMHGMKHGR
jgi:hypothetical protein